MPDEKSWIGQAEGFSLEAKSKKTPTTKDLEKDDIDGLARTICGFLNADGGTLVFGAITRKQDGLDIIEDMQHLEKCDALVSKIEASLSDWISPPPFGIKISAETEGDCSHIVIDIPRSDDAPHQCSVARNHRFYRRTLQGTIIMDHRMVQDAFLAIKSGSMQASLRLINSVISGGSGFRKYRSKLQIVLSGNGSGPAVTAPFIILEGRDATRFRAVHSTIRPGIIGESIGRGKKTFTTTSEQLLVPYTNSIFAEAEISFGVPPDATTENISRLVTTWGMGDLNIHSQSIDEIELNARCGGTNMMPVNYDLSLTGEELKELHFGG